MGTGLATVDAAGLCNTWIWPTSTEVVVEGNDDDDVEGVEALPDDDFFDATDDDGFDPDATDWLGTCCGSGNGCLCLLTSSACLHIR